MSAYKRAQTVKDPDDLSSTLEPTRWKERTDAHSRLTITLSILKQTSVEIWKKDIFHVKCPSLSQLQFLCS